MLDALRAASQSWAGRVIMGVVVLAFVFWGIYWVFADPSSLLGGNNVARVGSDTIGIEAFRSAYQTELQQLQEKARRAITNSEAQQMGIDRGVLSRLVSQSLLDQAAHRFGLALSDHDLAEAIVQDPAFKGPDGKFDRAVFENRLQEIGMTEARFVGEERRGYLRQQIIVPLTHGLNVPQKMVDAIHRYYSETRAIDYVILPSSTVGTIAPPSDAVLKTFYDAHQGEYRTPEYRKIVFLSVTLQGLSEKLAKTQPITDAEVKKHYEDVKAARFTEPEKRHVEQIAFPDQAAADAAAKKLSAGESFDALIAERKLTAKDVDLGTVTKDGMVDKSIAEAAFALKEGEVSKPVKGQFGWVLLRVGKVIPGQTIPYEKVALALRQELGLVRAHQEIGKIHDHVEDLRSSGKSLTEIAQATGLQIRTIDAISAEGYGKDGKPVPDVPDEQALLKAVFATDPGVDTEPLTLTDGGTVWFEVAGVEAARQQSLTEVKPKVLASWTDEERGKRLAAKSVDLVKKLDGGETLQALATETKLQLQHKDAIKRSGASGLTQSEVSGIFDRKVGAAGSAPTASGDRMVFKVTDATVAPIDPKNAEFSKTLDEVKDGLNEDIGSQYLGQLQREFGVSVNPQALQTAIGSE